jgi:phosphoenolpyruvate synthase/pyruvate phosphate dikinase
MKSEQKYIIMRNRTIMFCPAYWNSIVQASPAVKKLYGVNFNHMWMKFFRDQGQSKQESIYPSRELTSNGKYIVRRLLKEKQYFNKINKKEISKRKEIAGFIKIFDKRDISTESFSNLIKLTKKIKKLWIDYDIITVQIWFVAGDLFKEIVKNKLALQEDDFIFLSDQREKTYTSKLEEALLKDALIIQKNSKHLHQVARKLSNNFGWIPFGYDGPTYWDVNYFTSRLKKIAKTKKESLEEKIKIIREKDQAVRNLQVDLLKKYKINHEGKRLLEIMQIITVWTDERKAIDYKLNYFYAQIMYELEKRYNIPYENLKFLFVEELEKIKNNREYILNETKKRIDNEFVTEFRNEKGGIISKKKKKKFLAELESQMKLSKELRGIVASRGNKYIYMGKVKILSSAQDSRKIKKGDFLVAPMTTPDYILAMKRADGFITDEGGVTCHAAIIAREMNKPCIIGTRNATKILRDENIVKIDIKKGTIEILSR